MAFVNAWITPEDIEKYHLDQDYERSKGRIGIYENLKFHYAGEEKFWAIDREKESYFRHAGTGNRGLGMGEPGHNYFLLKWKDYYLFPIVKREKNQETNKEKKIAYYDCFLINDQYFIPQELIKFKDEIFHILREALDCYGEIGIISTYKYELTFKF